MSRGRTRGETDSFFEAAMEIAMKASLAKAELPGKEAAPAVEQQGGPEQFSGNDGGKGGHWNDMVCLLDTL